eukprot:CAMPEP_0198115118 /NCGR_PEP_ID=MMETSP1442-20131203/6302_1 /TAXON_ID= /ORGANISM="Craspedostauros australis, Strain CCMP3328" /LENGTH=498 /DNA_ID=CAMNT_0043772557 /DNA_START=37 /DNA_END=1533 /DNA_ORIENTATION=-
MVQFRSLALLSVLATAAASTEKIANYEPETKVTDHNALDQDQKLIETLLSETNNDQAFNQAKAVYEQGAFSKSVATLQVTALTAAFNKGDKVTGIDVSGETVTGTVFKNVAIGADELMVQYDTTAIQATYVDCKVGANPDPVTSGCLKQSGTITIEGFATPITYQYVVGTDNNNERNIQGFSLQAEDKMFDCGKGCPHATYNKFFKYYGFHNYADKWVQAAFAGNSAGLTNGNADFSQYTNIGKEQIIKKATSYMHIWMYVIREMEDAVNDCNDNCATEGCNDDPVHAWDEAVAFYTGSLEGTDGSGSGVMPYALADKRCQNFKTCGVDADQVTGTSNVNLEIFQEFRQGIDKLVDKQCADGRAHLEAIEKQMFIPLIQGTIRYAYKVGVDGDGEQSKSEGAAFAAAILPVVHACDEDDATTIYDNMRVGASSTDFEAVKKAFESQYKCMGVDGKKVGGLWNDDLQKYYDGAEPSSASMTTTILAFGAAGVAAVSMLF